MKSWKTMLLNSLGVLSTILSMVVIYLILYTTGVIKTLNSRTLIEFGVMTFLAIVARSFWYLSTENSIRTSDKYLKNKGNLIDYIDTEVLDMQDFDNFIDNENLRNFNLYIMNKCRTMTLDNFKLSFGDKLDKLGRRLTFRKQRTKLEYFNRRILKTERKAMKIHKLSSSNIVTLSNSNYGLTDDRNNAAKSKIIYFIGSTVTSILMMAVTSMVSFSSNEDVDTLAAATKMALYCSSILSSILQTIFNAHTAVQRDDIDYFKRIEAIITKYKTYKTNPIIVKRLNYLLCEEEVNNADNSSKKIEELQHNNFSQPVTRASAR
ncbi:MAG: hypothetical protein IKU15_00310 [Clostridia bacterium]|nr:hypothetical protein [Clostridia bacterium]MBR4889744.1 hypothetical protein [Clostridia bacterium]